MSENNKVDKYINEYFDKKSNVLETNELFRMIEEALGGIKVQAQKHRKVIEEEYNIDWDGYEKLFEEFESTHFKTSPSEELLEAKGKGKGKSAKGKTITTTLSLFLGPVTEAWGDPTSDIYEKVMPFVVKAAGAEKDFGKKLDHLFAVLDPDKHKTIKSQERIISSLILIEALGSMLRNFTEAPAGFVFEGFLAALTFGKQVNTKTKTGLPIEDIIAFEEEGPFGRPTSLKLLQGRTMRSHATPSRAEKGEMSQERSGTNIGGSWQNLFYLLDDRYPFVDYIVAAKEGAGEKTLKFHKFTISQKSLVDMMEISGNIGLFKASKTKVRAAANNWTELREIILASLGKEGHEEWESRKYQQILKVWSDEGEMEKYRSQDEWEPIIAKLEKDKRFRKKAIQYGQQLAATEKERGELSESTKSDTQWSIHQKFLPDLPGYALLGPKDGVDLSTEKLEEITERWTKILQGSLVELMKNFEELTQNLNAFFTSKERDKSIAKAGDARDNAKDMRRNLNSVQKQKEAEKEATVSKKQP